MVEIQITDEQLKAHLDKAIMASIDDATRDALIKDAIGELLKKQIWGSGYNKEERPSQMAELFAGAVHRLVKETVFELVNSDEEVREQVAGFARQFVMSFLQDQAKRVEVIESFTETFTTLMAKAMSNYHY